MGAKKFFDDRLNPLLVREIRQSLRSNVFNSLILVASLLSSIVVISGVLYSQSGNQGDSEPVGLILFQIIFMVLWLLCCAFLPAESSNRFKNERSKGEYDLFIITGIAPRHIVSGKLQASLLLSVFIIVMSAPFLMMCYLLRGVSSLDILIALAALLLFTILLTQLGIMFASFPVSKKIMQAMGAPFGLLILLTIIFAFTFVFSRNEFGNSAELFGTFIALLILSSYYFILSHLSSAAMLDTYSKNPARNLRIFLTASSLILLALSSTDFLPKELFYSYWKMGVFYVLTVPPLFLSAIIVPGVRSTEPPPPVSNTVFKGLAGRLMNFFFGVSKSSMHLWLATYFLTSTLTEFFLNNTKSLNEIPVMATATVFLFWTLSGNAIVSRISLLSSGIATSLISIALPTIASIFILVSQKNAQDISLLVCPLTVYAGAEELSMKTELAYACLIFQAVFFIYCLIVRASSRNKKPSAESGKGLQVPAE